MLYRVKIGRAQERSQDEDLSDWSRCYVPVFIFQRRVECLRLTLTRWEPQERGWGWFNEEVLKRVWVEYDVIMIPQPLWMIPIMNRSLKSEMRRGRVKLRDEGRDRDGELLGSRGLKWLKCIFWGLHTNTRPLLNG